MRGRITALLLGLLVLAGCHTIPSHELTGIYHLKHEGNSIYQEGKGSVMYYLVLGEGGEARAFVLTGTSRIMLNEETGNFESEATPSSSISSDIFGTWQRHGNHIALTLGNNEMFGEGEFDGTYALRESEGRPTLSYLSGEQNRGNTYYLLSRDMPMDESSNLLNYRK